MLKRMTAAAAVIAAMAIGGSGVALASHGADDPAGHHKGEHHHKGHHHHKGEHHHHGNHGPNHP
jgi:hypothetical protein